MKKKTAIVLILLLTINLTGCSDQLSENINKTSQPIIEESERNPHQQQPRKRQLKLQLLPQLKLLQRQQKQLLTKLQRRESIPCIKDKHCSARRNSNT